MRDKNAIPVVFKYGRTHETKSFRSPVDALAYAIDRSASIAASWTIEWCSAKWEDPEFHPDGRRKIKGDI